MFSSVLCHPKLLFLFLWISVWVFCPSVGLKKQYMYYIYKNKYNLEIMHFFFLHGIKKGCTIFQSAEFVLKKEEQLIFSLSTGLPLFLIAGDMDSSWGVHIQTFQLTSAPSISNSQHNGSWWCLSTARLSFLDSILDIFNSVIKHLLMAQWL